MLPFAPELRLARERPGRYESGDAPRESLAPASGAEPAIEPVPAADDLSALESVTDDVAAADLSEATDAEVRARLRRLQRCIDRLTGARAGAAGLLETRALERARPGREAQALRVTRQATASDLRLSPAQAQRDGEAGRRAAERPAQAQALRRGELTPDHARVLADTLRGLAPDVRDPLEVELLAAARSQDPVTFGRTCRQRLAELAPVAATRAQERLHAVRSLRTAQTSEGLLSLHGQGGGLAAEIIATALHAFRRPDAPGERRRPDQATFDALTDLCRSALDQGTAPTDRGVRPHVLITIDHDALVVPPVTEDGRCVPRGVAHGAWTGPMPYSEVRSLLADAGVARVLVDAQGVPLEASEEVRTVPAGLWRALLVRDGTCIGEGCTVPAAWCQVMHLDEPYRLGGRLRPDNAALGCSYHHRMLDHHGWRVRWEDRRPTLHPPDAGDRPPPITPRASRPPRPPDPPAPGPRPAGPAPTGSRAPEPPPAPEDVEPPGSAPPGPTPPEPP